jgi:hypothetical protein
VPSNGFRCTTSARRRGGGAGSPERAGTLHALRHGIVRVYLALPVDFAYAVSRSER